MRKVIGIDLDDVLADFIPAYVALANKRFGRPALDVLPVDWEWSNMLPDKDEQNLVWGDVDNVYDFWAELDVLPGVDHGLVRRLTTEHTVYFPTARRETVLGTPAAHQSARWLLNKFGIQCPTVIVSYEKGPLAAALKYDYFIDDRTKNCLDILKAVPTCKVFLKNSSHNQSFDAEANGITRIPSINEFAKLILEG